jgi:hypothetical protein
VCEHAAAIMRHEAGGLGLRFALQNWEPERRAACAETRLLRRHNFLVEGHEELLKMAQEAVVGKPARSCPQRRLGSCAKGAPPGGPRPVPVAGPLPQNTYQEDRLDVQQTGQDESGLSCHR